MSLVAYGLATDFYKRCFATANRICEQTIHGHQCQTSTHAHTWHSSCMQLSTLGFGLARFFKRSCWRLAAAPPPPLPGAGSMCVVRVALYLCTHTHTRARAHTYSQAHLFCCTDAMLKMGWDLSTSMALCWNCMCVRSPQYNQSTCTVLVPVDNFLYVQLYTHTKTHIHAHTHGSELTLLRVA